MVFKNKAINKFWRFSCSFQLGIPIMVAIAALTAWGTIVESKFDAYAAKQKVYDSWMMWTVMSLLVYNLTVVVIDRWPWKMRHYPFIFVHAGIILLIFGGWVTSRFGIDGSMPVNINGKNNYVTLPETDLVIYATFDGDRYTKMYDRPVDFFNHPPTKEKPYEVQFNNVDIKIIDYVPYGQLNKKVKAIAEDKTKDPNTLRVGSAIRFQMMNANVKQVEWVTQMRKGKTAEYNMGPAQIYLGDLTHKKSDKNEISLEPVDDTTLRYVIFRKNETTPFKSGQVKIGDKIETGWMGLEFRLLDYLPRAIEEFDVVALPKPTPMTTSAVLMEREGDKHWMVLNDVVKIFGQQEAYLLSYQNRRLDLGFNVQLKNFEVTRYQGTMRAKEYASQVLLDDQSATISMNKPAKHQGYTIYQASFQQDEMTGEPTASIFSINKDPGRWIKYIGSIVLSFGIVWLFYQRRKKATAIKDVV